MLWCSSIYGADGSEKDKNVVLTRLPGVLPTVVYWFNVGWYYSLSSVRWRRNCFADRTTVHTTGHSSIDTG